MPRASRNTKSTRRLAGGKGGKHAYLNDLEKELIFQTYAITGNIAETARQLGVAYNTAYNHIHKLAPEELAKVRREMTLKLAAKVHAHTDRILDSITPEELTTERYDSINKDGALVRREVGPSLLQKATAIGILVDKQHRLLEIERTLEGAKPVVSMVPGDVQSLVASLGSKIKSLRAFGLEVEIAEDKAETPYETAKEVVVEQDDISTGSFDFDG